MINLRIAALLVLFVLFCGLGGGLWLRGWLHAPLDVAAAQVIEVPRGASLRGVLAELDRRGMLGDERERTLRLLSVRLHDLFSRVSRRIHAGEYPLAPGDTLAHLLDRLERGDVLQRAFTLVEGWNIRQLRAALARAPGVEQTLAEVDDETLMRLLGREGRHPEGWFAPDTYFYVAGEKDVNILARALARQEAILTRYWDGRQAGLPYADPYDALIMASIVEKETGVEHEREEIAGVFVARLRKGMRLQTDPTVIYGLGERYDGNIRRRDLREATPYNTYVIRGLPPTPIAMPGEPAIRAALNPAGTDKLYFVARGDGSHHFSRTLEEHQQAVRRYQLQRRQDYRSAPPPAISAGARE